MVSTVYQLFFTHTILCICFHDAGPSTTASVGIESAIARFGGEGWEKSSFCMYIFWSYIILVYFYIKWLVFYYLTSPFFWKYLFWSTFETCTLLLVACTCDFSDFRRDLLLCVCVYMYGLISVYLLLSFKLVAFV